MALRNPTLATAQLIRTPAYQQIDAHALATVTNANGYEAARERRALGVGPADVGLNPTSDCPVAICIDMARISMGVKQAALFQRWLPLHQLTRDTGKQGFTRAEFDAALLEHGVKGCDAYNARLLRRGHTLYWNLHNGMIYPCGVIELTRRLIVHAAEHGLHDLFTTNAPGSMRPMYLNVSGTQADFEASILNGWYAAKNNPMISRLAMCTLFHRSEYTLRQLERRAGIQITTNTAETTDSASVPLKPYGSLRNDVYRTIEKGRTVYHFRLANTYTSTRCKQHFHLGQGRKTTFLFKQWIESDRLPGLSAADGLTVGKLNRLRRIYCKNENVAQRSRRRGNENGLLIPDRPGQGGSVIWGVYKH